MPRGDKKAYTTVLARIPQDLADQVKQDASQHWGTVSELIRDGLEMRLESGDVPGPLTGHHGEAGEEVLHEVLPHHAPGHAPEQGGMTEVFPHSVTFDPAKFYLGKLCPKGHDYQGTGMSLLRCHNQRCRECENQAKRAKRAARRTAAAPEG